MVSHRLVVAAVSLVVAVAFLGVSDAASGKSSTATVYRLRHDARMCPSPLCGGFWASRVNRTTTQCRGGRAQPSCYVASVDLSALPVGTRVRAQAAVNAGDAFVTGVFAPNQSDAFPKLARLVASRVWITTRKGSTTTVYRIVDTGVRCIRAPCFSFRAVPVNRTTSVALSDLDLSGTGESAGVISMARVSLSHAGILATGTIRVDGKPGTPDEGRTFVATQLWLPA